MGSEMCIRDSQGAFERLNTAHDDLDKSYGTVSYNDRETHEGKRLFDLGLKAGRMGSSILTPDRYVDLKSGKNGWTGAQPYDVGGEGYVPEELPADPPTPEWAKKLVGLPYDPDLEKAQALEVKLSGKPYAPAPGYSFTEYMRRKYVALMGFDPDQPVSLNDMDRRAQ